MLLFYSTAVECIKELIVRCKYDTLMQLIEKEDGWKLFEDEKTFPDGVVVIARYVNTSGQFSGRLCSRFLLSDFKCPQSLVKHHRVLFPKWEMGP